MASANLDLVRSILAGWERGDYSWTEWAHPEIEFVFADGPTPGRWTGLAGLAEAWRDFLSVWEEFRSAPDSYRELDDERVLALVHYGGRGKTSGLEVAQIRSDSAGVFHLRAGKVTRLTFYFDRGRALADLGLAPERALADLGLTPEAGAPGS
jgi:ketosteroid isomerase-like protein